MAFWKENNHTPKRKYRFQIQFGRNDSGNTTSASTAYWWAKTVKVPTFSVASVEHHYLDNRYNFPGRVTWEDIDMTLVDPSDPDAVNIIMDMLQRSGYSVKGENDPAATIAKQQAAKVQCVITTLDESGAIIETWTLQNCFILSANLGDYDYSSDDLRELSLTLKYDWATCEVSSNEYFPAAN